MLFKKYILTTLRLILSKWWVSLIKIFSLTSGILSFLLVWLFYIDHQFFIDGQVSFWKSCAADNVGILGFIVFVTSVIYFLIMKSQIQLRYKELFFKKYYGETPWGIIGILMIETSIFILFSFLLCLVLIDQISPVFNLFTDRNINLQQHVHIINLVMIFCFLSFLGFVVGILPSYWFGKIRAVDILHKLQE